MDDMAADWEIRAALRQRRSLERRAVTVGQLEEAAARAGEHGMAIRKFSDSHYQLTGPPGVNGRRWILDVHPGHCHLVRPRCRKPGAPRLEIESPWTLLDVVEAAIVAVGGGRRVKRRKPPCTIPGDLEPVEVTQPDDSNDEQQRINPTYRPPPRPPYPS